MRIIPSPGRRRWLTAIGTFLFALYAGFFMQAVLTRNPLFSTPVPTPPVTPVHTETTPPLVNLSPHLKKPASYPDRVVEKRRNPRAGCTPELEAIPAPGASVWLLLDAPCHPNTPFTLHHGPLKPISLRTNMSGSWTQRLPAFVSPSGSQIDFQDHTLSTMAHLPGTNAAQHVVLEWNGPQAFTISNTGSENTRLTHLTQPDGSGVQILSLPSHHETSVLRITVEATVTEATCAQTQTANAFEFGSDNPVAPTQIAMKFPDCTEIGSVIRLQNLFRDMRVAKR